MHALPDVQLELRPGIVDFSWGHPDLALLPAAQLAEAAQLALSSSGPAALSYGAEQGPGRLLEQLAAWLARREGHAPSSDQLVITGGVSQALDLLCTLLAQPRDVALVQSPVYHLALRIFRDHHLTLVPVESDTEGVRPEALAEALASCRGAGQRVAFFYTVPTFCNPTGVTLSLMRRQAVVDLAALNDLLILEDDVYRHLWYDEPAPASLYDLAPAGSVVRLGSFSKVLAPGLRLGWLAAGPVLVRRWTGSGMLDSGGGVSHFAAHVVAEYIARGWLDEHVETLRAAYRVRRDVLLSAMADYLPSGCSWRAPGGGFFVWLCLPPGADSAAILPAAESAGAAYVPGARFSVEGGGAAFCRLAFTLLEPGQMIDGIRRLAVVFGGQSRGPVQ